MCQPRIKTTVGKGVRLADSCPDIDLVCAGDTRAQNPEDFKVLSNLLLLLGNGISSTPQTSVVVAEVADFAFRAMLGLWTAGVGEICDAGNVCKEKSLHTSCGVCTGEPVCLQVLYILSVLTNYSHNFTEEVLKQDIASRQDEHLGRSEFEPETPETICWSRRISVACWE